LQREEFYPERSGRGFVTARASIEEVLPRVFAEISSPKPKEELSSKLRCGHPPFVRYRLASAVYPNPRGRWWDLARPQRRLHMNY
jgi:hypothetical protein